MLAEGGDTSGCLSRGEVGVIIKDDGSGVPFKVCSSDGTVYAFCVCGVWTRGVESVLMRSHQSIADENCSSSPMHFLSCTRRANTRRCVLVQPIRRAVGVPGRCCPSCCCWRWDIHSVRCPGARCGLQRRVQGVAPVQRATSVQEGWRRCHCVLPGLAVEDERRKLNQWLVLFRWINCLATSGLWLELDCWRCGEPTCRLVSDTGATAIALPCRELAVPTAPGA